MGRITYRVLEFRSALNLQLKTGCRILPWIWKTTGLHSGSPPNWNTNRGSGSDRTSKWSRADVLSSSFPKFTHPFWNVFGLFSAPSIEIAIRTRPSNLPELTPHVLPIRPAKTERHIITGLPESRRKDVGSRWKPADDAAESGGESPETDERGRSAVWEGKFLIAILQKQGVVDGWTAAPAGRVAWGRLRERDSTISRTNGQGSIGKVAGGGNVGRGRRRKMGEHLSWGIGVWTVSHWCIEGFAFYSVSLSRDRWRMSSSWLFYQKYYHLLQIFINYNHF